MFQFFRFWLGSLSRCFHSRQSLLLENLALRQQLAVLKRRHPRPKLSPLDKLCWARLPVLVRSEAGSHGCHGRREWDTLRAPRRKAKACGARARSLLLARADEAELDTEVGFALIRELISELGLR